MIFLAHSACATMCAQAALLKIPQSLLSKAEDTKIKCLMTIKPLTTVKLFNAQTRERKLQ